MDASLHIDLRPRWELRKGEHLDLLCRQRSDQCPCVVSPFTLSYMSFLSLLKQSHAVFALSVWPLSVVFAR